MVMKTQADTLRVAVLTALILGGCGEDGKRGPSGPPVQATPTELAQGEEPPGIVLTILELKGASSAGGQFQVGDRLSVRFTARKHDGSDWDTSELDFGRILVSGPSFNYQRVLPEEADLFTKAKRNQDGSLTYAFAAKLPAVYAPPLNDTPSFGADDGELTGQALLGGTYTVGMYAGWNFTVDGQSARDAGDATADFLLGGAVSVHTRDVVAQENCNQCHGSLRAHGGLRRDVKLCALCHTAGAEDRNVASAAGGTPGRTIELSVMIHKIHNGAHLPSVLGVTTLPGGARDYGATPRPFELVGFGNDVIDYSDVGFPVWPNLNIAMPRDAGYSALGATEKALEDTIRTGVTDCNVCHGDPDGGGPLTGPAQGDTIYSGQSRRDCGSCHDDVVWTEAYTANDYTMPPQLDDASCTLCHIQTGSAIAVRDAHLHPLKDPGFNPGLNFAILGVAEAAAVVANGRIDPGEKIEVTFTLRDDAGLDVDPLEVPSMSVVVSGPTSNYNLLLRDSIAASALSGPQPFVINLPETVVSEYVGSSSGATFPQVFATARAPHWAGTTAVSAAVPAGASTLLSAGATAPQNFIDVVDSTGILRNDVIVIDDGMPGREYLKVQWVDGNRLWFSSPQSSGYQPGLRADHLAGDTVDVVSLTALTEGVDYSLDALAGTISELVELGGVALVVDYVSDFVMPGRYPLALNDSPDLDETIGKWTGKSLVDGTYSVALWGNRNLSLALVGETNSYRGTAPAALANFLVGGATTLEPYALIADAANCYACHQDLYFHGGGRRGFESCLICHGTAGAEDRPRYVAANAPDTTGLTVNFRSMLHKIHQGEELANAATYGIVGFGLGYPNNFGVNTYEHVVFPALPGGTSQCTSCHGESNTAWREPAPRDHPTEQAQPVRRWAAVCGECHDSNAAQAHIAEQTTPAGVESCGVCHGVGRDLEVRKVHKSY
jgi:hypothetical protein